MIESGGAHIDELVAKGRVRTTGDAPRALEMARIIAKGPPLVWSSLLRVVPVDAAFFGATEVELLQAFPGWQTRDRRPLLEPPLRFVLAPLAE